MKKLFAILLVLSLMLSLSFALISCDNTPDDNGGASGDNGGNEGNNGNNGGNEGSGNGDGGNGGTNDDPVIEGPIIPWPMD